MNMGTPDAMEKRHFALPLLVMLLSGCQFWITGHSDDYGLVVYGEGVADPMAATSKFNLVHDGTGVKCDGESRPKDGSTQRAIITVRCDDGRSAEGESWLLAMDTGEGRGTDNCGNGFYMTFSTNKFYVDSKVAEYRKKMAEAGTEGNDKCDAAGDVPPHTDPLI